MGWLSVQYVRYKHDSLGSSAFPLALPSHLGSSVQPPKLPEASLPSSIFSGDVKRYLTVGKAHSVIHQNEY